MANDLFLNYFNLKQITYKNYLYIINIYIYF